MRLNNNWKQGGMMGLGTVVNSLLGLLFYVLVGRALGVTEFGIFSFILGLGIFSSEIGDLGVGSGIIRFGSNRLPGAFTLALLVKIIVSIGIIFLFGIIAFWVNNFLIYSALVAITLLFSFLVTQSLIAKQKFNWFVSANIFGNVLRLLLIVLVIKWGLLTSVSAVVVFCLGGLATFILGIIPILSEYRSRLFSLKEAKLLWPEAFPYGRNLAFSFSLASVSAKIDVPLIFIISGATAVGIYSAAMKLVSILPQIAASLEGVFAPKFSNRPINKKDFRDYFMLVAVIGLALLITSPIAANLVPMLFGWQYLSGVPVFAVLLLSMIPFFLTGPFSAYVLYHAGRSGFHLVVSLIALILNSFLYLYLIPALGALGAAVAGAISNLLILFIYIFLWKKFSNLNE